MFKSSWEEEMFHLSRYGWIASFLAILAMVLMAWTVWKRIPYFFIWDLLILAIWLGVVNLLLRRFREVQERERRDF